MREKEWMTWRERERGDDDDDDGACRSLAAVERRMDVLYRIRRGSRSGIDHSYRLRIHTSYSTCHYCVAHHYQQAPDVTGPLLLLCFPSSPAPACLCLCPSLSLSLSLSLSITARSLFLPSSCSLSPSPLSRSRCYLSALSQSPLPPCAAGPCRCGGQGRTGRRSSAPARRLGARPLSSGAGVRAGPHWRGGKRRTPPLPRPGLRRGSPPSALDLLGFGGMDQGLRGGWSPSPAHFV
ncbi:hypothetical protein PAHAL_7G129300 [Panicum hallii]|uniref:Uncharacterized protein n=1 Tax=Panicum hallii TaxID=206008 RepID=A0A2T8IC45_9POAL|nr:hypothetical protein PAHAL_7G129300 [Panicum hallii]